MYTELDSTLDGEIKLVECNKWETMQSEEWMHGKEDSELKLLTVGETSWNTVDTDLDSPDKELPKEEHTIEKELQQQEVLLEEEWLHREMHGEEETNNG